MNILIDFGHLRKSDRGIDAIDNATYWLQLAFEFFVPPKVFFHYV